MIHTLEIDSVILEFGYKRVLQDVYLKCETNSITGLLGRNGAGKSCLMNILYGQLKPMNGLTRLNKQAILGAARKPEDLMFLPQFGFIPKFLTLKRIFLDFNLDFAAFINQFPEFKKLYRSKIGSLSGGEKRIIEIYLILASNTKFCLLDEPFSHVMPLHIDCIKDLIKNENRKKGILITDHMYEHILDICNPIYLIKDGKTHSVSNIEDLELLGYISTSTDNTHA